MMKTRFGLTGVLALALLLGLAVGIGLAQGPEPPSRKAGVEGALGSAATMSSRIPTQRQLTGQPSVEHKSVSPKSDSHDLLIITPAEFSPVLDPLVEHKNATGISAVMITLEDIYGDPSLSGVDEPEQIKRAIERYEQDHAIKYVMLAGDVDKFPVRWVTHNSGANVAYFFPSDLYYADLYDSSGAFDDWDHDGDGLFGEQVKNTRCSGDLYNVNLDRVNLHPDVAVGRVPASTVEELEGYVAKVIKYEYLTSGSDWFHDVLLIAGDGRTCDPGVHFEEIQRRFDSHSDDFAFRTYIHDSYLTSHPDHACRPCFRTGTETTDECLERTGLRFEDQEDVFSDAMWAGTTWNGSVPVAEFEDVGLLGWHDHGSGIRDYNNDVNNADRFTVAFADGCSDGGFAGGPAGGMARFAPTESGGQNLSYATADGHTLQVLFVPAWVDHDGDGEDSKFYHITGCVFDGTSYPLDGAQCGGGILPTMTFSDDFGLDNDATTPITRNQAYILGAPPPASLQPYDWDAKNPETKLFAKFAATGEETGWVGMVGATKGTSFVSNGELMSQFFRGYGEPHSSVGGRSRLGDMWRSMEEYWLDEVVYAMGGDFHWKYNIDKEILPDTYCTLYGLHHAMLTNLFGDPSLRVGGVEDLEDTSPPTTSVNTDSNWWHSEDVMVTLTATDGGSPPSGVRETRYRLDSGDWETGSSFVVEALPDHSNDGVHAIECYSVDFLGNTEVAGSTEAEVRIDTVAPDTDVLLDGEPPVRVSQASAVPLSIASATQELTAGLQGMLFYPSGSKPPSRGCYNSSVEVTLTATDDRSGVASTWYDLGGLYPLGAEYTTPFDVVGGDILDMRTLDYWSEDNAGNVEPRESVRFCVSNWQAGIVKEEIRILAALKEIVMIQMWEELASALPPIDHVRFERTYGPEFIWIGTDWDGSDGWSVPWNTAAVDDGNYVVRMLAYPPKSVKGVQQSPIHVEVAIVKVCNVPDSAYEFDLDASSGTVDRGESVAYTLSFVNTKVGDPLTNLTMTVVTDAGLFDPIKVLDGGSLDARGMPTWSKAKMGLGEEWRVRFNARVGPSVVPGTVIASQALLVADTVPQLLSDNPHTSVEGDVTAVRVNLIDGSITGQVEDTTYGTPISASVAMAGPISKTVATDATGNYTATNLPPGGYTVSVEAEDYDYHSPTGPVIVTLDGTVENVQVDFVMALVDEMPPVSSMHLSADEIVLAKTSVISGTAHDYPPGTGVNRVELSIFRADDERYWDGDSWEDDETWLLASGTTAWTLDCGGITWDDGSPYAVQSRATDNAGNVETPIGSVTTPDLQAPSLIAPADGAQVDDTYTFRWSHVLDSQYHLQMDNDSNFQSPEVDEPYAHVNTYAPLGLAGGTYHWRVKAIDKEHGHPESDWSEVWTVTIEARIYLPLVLRNESAASSSWRGSGRRDGMVLLLRAPRLAVLPQRCQEGP
jgi:hypothetical protein